jgi:predicted CXXCH cytochrome family protein
MRCRLCAIPLILLTGCGLRDERPGTPASAATFVEESRCADCHAAAAAAWQGSHHQLAMQPIAGARGLGDFSGRGVAGTRFHRRDSLYFVETTGPDGRPATYQVQWVFGVYPLQQILIPLPVGRLQAFNIAWDSVRGRWFDLMPEAHSPRDPLHWSAPQQNWNYMCAECHATALRRNWDTTAAEYRTSWHRLDVGCQACHGPGSRHVDWADAARADSTLPPPDSAFGLEVKLPAREARVEIETCARCHARRAPLGDGFEHRNRLMDDYLPALLDEGLYYADGQIREEDYEYGSFQQSRMFAKGLRCSDCHDPHTQRTRLNGNALCTSCHNSEGPTARPGIDTRGLRRAAYDSISHTFHRGTGPGTRCVNCHAPITKYMVVDPRLDHSFRIPRPDLSVRIGVPDACTRCHDKERPAWAAAQVAAWYGPGRRQEPHYGLALDAARRGAPGAAAALDGLVRDSAVPAIVRATALSLLVRYPGRSRLSLFGAALSDPDPQVRHAALAGYAAMHPTERAAAIRPLLSDSVRAVRIEAARMLVGASSAALGDWAESWRVALAEYEAVQQALKDQAGGWGNLGALYLEQGRGDEAERAFRQSVEQDSTFVPGYVNLADVRRSLSGEESAEAVLRAGLARNPDAGQLYHALGLGLWRQQRREEGLTALARAATLAPEDPRMGFVHAVALHDLGRPAEARRVLEGVLARHRWDRETLLTLSAYRVQSGDRAGAAALVEQLTAINSEDPALRGAGQE